MSELERMIRDSAASDEWVADWGDVLRRSGHTRFRSRRAAAIAAVAAVAVVLLLPGIGIGGGLNALLSGSRPPGLQLQAALIGKDGPVAVVTLRTSRIFVAIAPGTGRVKAFFPRGKTPIPPLEARWSIEVARGTTVTSARILDHAGGRVLARLCSTCRNGAHGTVGIRRRTLSAVFGRALVVAETDRGPVHGTLALPTPLR